MSLLRATVITDIHCGMDLKKKIGCKLGSWAPNLLEAFTRISNDIDPDCVVNMGDNYIANRTVFENADYEKHQEMLSNYFNRLRSPCAQLQGNHDFAVATHRNKQGSKRFPLKPRPRPLEFERSRAIFWNSNPNVWKAGATGSGRAQKDWLKRTLDSTDKPTVVFSHAPFDYYKDAAELRYIMRDYGNVVLGMHGHKHQPDRLELIEGIPYFTQQAFTEKQPGNPFPWGAYSDLRINEDGTIKIERKNIMAPCTQDRSYIIQKNGDDIRAEILAPSCSAIPTPEAI